MQLKKNDFYIIGSGKKTSILDFVKKCFRYVNLNYKDYLIIDKKLFRKGKTKTLVADTTKAKKDFKFRVNTNLDKLIKIMMDNDLNLYK